MAANDTFLCVSYDADQSKAFCKRINDFTQANRTDYIHFRSDNDRVPITISTSKNEKDGTRIRDRTQYFVLDKEEIKTIKDCNIKMTLNINVEIKDKGTDIHVVSYQNNQRISGFLQARDKCDGLIIVVHKKMTIDKSGKSSTNWRFVCGNKFFWV